MSEKRLTLRVSQAVYDEIQRQKQIHNYNNTDNAMITQMIKDFNQIEKYRAKNSELFDELTETQERLLAVKRAVKLLKKL